VSLQTFFHLCHLEFKLRNFVQCISGNEALPCWSEANDLDTSSLRDKRAAETTTALCPERAQSEPCFTPIANDVSVWGFISLVTHDEVY
jgi:hypothetical protein